MSLFRFWQSRDGRMNRNPVLVRFVIDCVYNCGAEPVIVIQAQVGCTEARLVHRRMDSNWAMAVLAALRLCRVEESQDL